MLSNRRTRSSWELKQRGGTDMDYILDTQIFRCADAEPARLSVNARKLLADAANRLFLSASSIWENIENGSRWQRDKLWREDAHLMHSHRRAYILSTLRQLALHLHSLRNLNSAKPCPISHHAQSDSLNLHQSIKLLLQTS